MRVVKIWLWKSEYGKVSFVSNLSVMLMKILFQALGRVTVTFVTAHHYVMSRCRSNSIAKIAIFANREWVPKIQKKSLHPFNAMSGEKFNNSFFERLLITIHLPWNCIQVTVSGQTELEFQSNVSLFGNLLC